MAIKVSEIGYGENYAVDVIWFKNYSGDTNVWMGWMTAKKVFELFGDLKINGHGDLEKELFVLNKLNHVYNFIHSQRNESWIIWFFIMKG